MNEFRPRHSFEVHDGEIGEDDVKIEYIGSQAFPKIPIKLALYSLGLFFTGIILFIVGTVQEITNFKEPSRGIAFWVLGSLTFIPGCYFSYIFYKAYRAKTPMERLTVLRSIPESN
jgi:hypothetical protein